MDQRTFDNKVKELAEKLKQSGVVTSDSMAYGMARDIIRTEQSTREKYEQPSASQDSEPEQQQSDAPKNLVVEEAIKNAQQSNQQARVESDIDQDKSIAELLQEEEDRPAPKITLDTPVVDNGVAREEVRSQPAQQAPPKLEPEKQQQPAVETESSEDDKQPEVSQPQQSVQEKPQDKPKDDRPKVDLSEMFNFSKK